MLSITKLNKEEIDFMISVFEIENIRKYFQKYPRALQKLTPRRAKSLSYDQIRSLIQKNISSDFVYSFMQNNTESFIHKFDDSVKKIESRVKDKIKAFIIALADSPLKDNISIYFKLNEKAIDDDYLELLSFLVNMPDVEKMLLGENDNNDLSLQIEGLTKQLTEKEDLIKSDKVIFKQFQKETEQKTAEINKELDEANLTIAALRSELEKWESAEHISEEDIDDGYTFHSLCRVYEYNSKLWISRLADIEKNELIPFKSDTDKPAMFGNNIWLRHTTGPKEIGYIGVWAWYYEENWKKPGEDYTHSLFCDKYTPIEVINISGNTTKEEIGDYLKNGIKIKPSTNRVLFSIKTYDAKYIGILCSDKDWDIHNGLLKLNSDCYSVDVYSFDAEDTIELDGKIFYRYLKVKGVPTTRKLYDPIKIVTDIVLKRASWNAIKQKGISKNTWKLCREYISELPQEDLYKEICDTCKCSVSDAKQYISDLIENATTYINNENIENEVIANIIPKHPEIIEKCKDIIYQDWKSENEVMLIEARKELQTIESQISDKNSILENVQNEHKRLSDELSVISAKITEKENLATDVDERIRNKIDDAKKNAAEFISQMAFVSPVSSITDSGANICYSTGKELDSNGIEEYNSATTFHSLISEELQNSGVAKKFRDSLAAYMYSAFITHTPLLLAGPCGKSIANAFSAALNARLAGVLNCSLPYNKNTLTDIVNNDDKVVIIENPFSSEWVYSIIDLISTPDKFFVLVTPFTEDLSIEPKGLLNYCLPIFTESFIDSTPTNAFIGSKPSEDFLPPVGKKTGNRLYNQLLQKMKVPSLAIKRINNVIEQAGSVYEVNEGTNLLYILLPCSYITQSEDSLLKAIHNDNNILSKASSEYIKLAEQYLGESDE